MIKVLLDPAHGKETAGKRSPDGSLEEWAWSREVLQIIEAELDRLGIPHQRTWDGDNEPGLTKRCRIANKIAKTEPCILVSFHVNAASSGSWMGARGWSVYVSPNASGKSRALASMMAAVAQECGLKVRHPDQNHNYWTANLAMCRDTSMPAVLIENLFMDNKEDCAYLLSEEGKQKCAEVCVRGICLYLGVAYEPIHL